MRGLAKYGGNTGFVTCANDRTVRVWSAEGECLQVLKGHSAFVYAVEVLESGEIISCGEDRTVRIWREGVCVQSLALPAISVWCVRVLRDGSLAVGSNEGSLRVFTRDEAKTAPQEVLEAFHEAVRRFPIPSNEIEDMDPAGIRAVEEALREPGAEIGEVRVARDQNGRVCEFQWNGQPPAWEKIGEVEEPTAASSAEGGAAVEERPALNGKTYDFVFEVEQGEGKPNWRLPFNRAQNPNVAAQDFIQQEGLSQGFLGQIAEFICLSAGVPPPNPELLASKRVYSLAAQVDVPPLLASIKEAAKTFGEDDPLALSEAEKQTLETAADILGRPDDYRSTTLPEGHLELVRKLLRWPEEVRLPCLGLLQATLQHPTSAVFMEWVGQAFFRDLLAAAGLSPPGKVREAQEAGLRCLVNAFRYGTSRGVMAAQVPFLLDELPITTRRPLPLPGLCELLHK